MTQPYHLTKLRLSLGEEMDAAEFTRIVGTVSHVVFWSIVVGTGLSISACNYSVKQPMRDIFAVGTALFFTIAACGMIAILWAALQ